MKTIRSEDCNFDSKVELRWRKKWLRLRSAERRALKAEKTRMPRGAAPGVEPVRAKPAERERGALKTCSVSRDQSSRIDRDKCNACMRRSGKRWQKRAEPPE